MTRKSPALPRETFDELDATSRLAAIVESSADAMIGKTLDGTITTWNAGARQMYGYEADEIVGRNVSVLVQSKQRDELPAILQRVANGERIQHYETERLRKDGSVVEVSVSFSPIRGRDGAIVGISTVTIDITDRKRAEAHLRDLDARLHQAQRLESVGQLAGGIAHDFNNLLAGIMNYSTLATDGLAELTNRLGLAGDPTVVTLEADIAEIAKVANRAARLTRQLLVFSRRGAFKPEVVDLNAIVVDTETLLHRTIGETITLETELAANLPFTKADRAQIEQVLMNLAVNARDAMTNGGTLRITTAVLEPNSKHAHQRGIGLGPYVRLTVSDTGCGMSSTVSDRAFEPFFTTKEEGEGSGLGLATVYGIVTQAGGYVVISSQPERGTSVEVMLPVTDETASALPDEAPARPLASYGETILLVEDEDIVREPTRRILIGSGYTVLTASNAEEALLTADAHAGDIELLLTDMIMPGRSGKELAAALQRIRAHIKVLYMSGYTSLQTDLGAAKQQAANTIDKPFAAEDLLQRVQEVLAAE
jgi:two-component system cell cycle sensor histidine kinase/response regulator CckA